ncbi:hypothetical protein ABL78_1442 [Leptomonas seymouri]|uniref:Uncharacterized protein n=1 Tax=Leptomonas seymouri TaxID=5684 RepID=A0A0N1I7I5_LEPSE|nr:hypothetical protein ABL78_1442 [Leptomonas seymouri]|eukprot:KPI89478.1 hypothetical protein ABL78_1442 [Leptomonas seymouri]
MPKRHRQPEPIDIQSAAHHNHHAAVSAPKNTFTQSSTASNVSSSLSSASSGAARSGEGPIYSPMEQKLVEETRRKVVDFPATPETLARHRRKQEADEKRRRVSYDRDGQPLCSADASASAANRKGKSLGAKEQLASAFLPASASSLTSKGFDLASGDDDDLEDDNNSDLSSNDYVGDDGNQPSTDSELDSAEEDDESELRELRKAMAAAQRYRAGAEDDKNAEVSSSQSAEGGSGGEEEDDDEEEDSDDEEAPSDSDVSTECDEDDEDGSLSDAAQRDSNGDEEEDDDELDDGGLITVDFGVFDMEKSNVDGLVHLMDQLCPDKMNEVDRDDLGLALYESPFTSVVRLQNNGEDTTGEEAQEFYGLSSVLDVAHGRQLYKKSLQPLCELLQQHVWRQAAFGIPPTDILTSVVDDELVSTSRAKCLLLISEYIRNIPLELTVQILEDILNRLDAAGSEESSQKQKAGATHENPIFATQPSMFAVLAKVQRATDAPVTLPKQQQPQGGSDASGDGTGTSSLTQPSSSSAGAAAKKHHRGRRSEKPAGADGGSAGAPEAAFDLTHYIFWREEDSVLYEFRDKRVAALVYRCRPQYDGQPEHEIPLSLLFVLQYGAVRQAVDEMKRRQTVNAAVERY